jgi:outer membrane protein assembly factor BamD (BamD/ComL family)
LKLAELSFDKQQYRQAYNFYDSLRLDDPSLKDVDKLTAKKEMLGKLATNIEIIARQDSLQRIAQLPEDERKNFVKKLVKQIRRQQGLKDEGLVTTSSPFTTTTAPTLFPSVQSKGEWYFYNTAFRTRGQADFKARWGNRPNIDNWRRSASIAAGLQNRITQNPTGINNNNNGITNNQDNTPIEITYENLYDNLPLTTEQLQKSNDSIQDALYKLGTLYIQEVEDCPAGTETFEQLRNRFPQFDKMDEVLFNLYYCYNKNGETAKAEAIKKLMSEKNANSNFTRIITTGKNPQSIIKSEATATYEKVYDLFIEGNFEEAVEQKKIADSAYGKNYWTPQLLYIESVYYIKQRDDSTAKIVLNNIISQFPGTPLANKATTLLDVLGRRKQIETELQNMVVNRHQEDTTTRIPANNIIASQNVKDTSANKQRVITKTNPSVDSLAKQPPKNIISPYAFKEDAQHYVVLILNKVDPVFSNEAKNAFFRYNRESFYNKTMAVDLIELDSDNRLLLISPFKTAQEAVDYIDRTRPKTASEIIPWLKGGKYSFSIINDNNLQLLKTNKDLENYKTFLNQHLPGKF